jgi:hypothetical protein
MLWTILLGVLGQSALANTALVFTRETPQGQQIILQENQQETTLSQGAGLRLFPHISSDAKRVVWVEGTQEKKLQIIVYDRQTRSRERWETGKTGVLHPRFSRDGKRIFFAQPLTRGHRISFFEADAFRTRLMSVDPDGTRVYRATLHELSHTGSGIYPRPSADGTFVIFERKTFFSREIVEFDIASKRERVLVEGESPALSSDEVWLLYTLKGDIWITHRLSGDTVAMTNTAALEKDPSFTSDNRVNFSSNISGKFQLYQLQEQNWKRLVTSAHNDTSLNFAGETDWTQSSLVSLPMSTLFKTVTHQGKVYALGDGFFVYEPTTGTWRALASRPHLSQQAPLAANGKYIYAFGSNETNRIDRYDMTTDHWSTIAELSATPTSAAIIEDHVYLFTKAGLSAEVFNLAQENLMRTRWVVPTQLAGELHALSYQESLLLFSANNFVVLDPQTGFTRELATPPFDVESAGLAVVEDELIAIGGMKPNSAMSKHIYVFDLMTKSWRHSGRYLLEGRANPEVVNFDEGIMILGGDEERERQTVETFQRPRTDLLLK